jgi:rhomboid family GlyGly-CTERM serine protease
VTRGSVAWVGLAGLLGACALLGWRLQRETIDWQNALALSEPWRAFSAVGVHYSERHLWANLAGVVLVAAFGVAARVPVRIAWAWFAAWPLTQFGLLVRPELAHYGGLSGVLHAGMAAALTYLIFAGRPSQRWVARVVLLGLFAKLASESPWGPALTHPADWDIAVAPIVHVTGAFAGIICAAVACWWSPRTESRDST